MAIIIIPAVFICLFMAIMGGTEADIENAITSFEAVLVLCIIFMVIFFIVAFFNRNKD